MISYEYGRGVEAVADPVDLLQEVPALVVDGQDDRDVELLLVRAHARIRLLRRYEGVVSALRAVPLELPGTSGNRTIAWE